MSLTEEISMSGGKGDIHHLVESVDYGSDVKTEGVEHHQAELTEAQHISLSTSKGIAQSFREDRKAMFVVVIALANAFILGTDTSIIGALVGSQSFCKLMGEGYQNSPGVYAVPPRVVTIWNGVSAPAQVLGQLTVGPLADWLGRRKLVFINIAVMLLGVVIEITAPNWKAFTAAEFIMPYTSGLLQSTAPLLVSELSPRGVRGIMMTAFPMIGSLGNLLSVFLTWACQRRWEDPDIKWAYRVPLIVSLVLPAIVLVIQIFFLPESPSWSIMHGKPDEARKAIAYMYPNRSKDEHELLFAEYEYTLGKEANFQEQGKTATFAECFKGTDWRRTFCAFFPSMTSSMMGNSVVGPQATYFFTIAGQNNALASTCISLACGFVGLILLSLMIDRRRIGRKRLLQAGQCGMTLAMFGIAISATAFSTPYPHTAGNLMLAFLCIGLFSAQIGPSGCGWTYIGESGSLRLRAKTTTLGNLGNGILGTSYNIAIPYMITSSNFGIRGATFWYGGWGVVAIIMTYFLVPDYTGRSYAQIDEMFVKKVPARKFRTYVCDGDYGRDVIGEVAHGAKAVVAE